MKQKLVQATEQNENFWNNRYICLSRAGYEVRKMILCRTNFPAWVRILPSWKVRLIWWYWSSQAKSKLTEFKSDNNCILFSSIFFSSKKDKIRFLFVDKETFVLSVLLLLLLRLLLPQPLRNSSLSHQQAEKRTLKGEKKSQQQLLLKKKILIGAWWRHSLSMDICKV